MFVQFLHLFCRQGDVPFSTRPCRELRTIISFRLGGCLHARSGGSGIILCSLLSLRSIDCSSIRIFA
ncbi:hypothetical protein XELAEV_18011744mg [Xenopus laevis]|uniref:Uncharacterized protein n=1 Tax=Xenopus laevis TaxID=8355 RepID=A0A974DMV6_XENLA|nr:hypothetical protein XELAEV_18011744mg [Xenopus laevis]